MSDIIHASFIHMQEDVLLGIRKGYGMSCELNIKDILEGTAKCLCLNTLLTGLTPESDASGAGSLSSLRKMKGWPQSEEWKLSRHPETTVSLSDLTDGQVAWFADSTQSWIIQKAGNVFCWYLYER